MTSSLVGSEMCIRDRWVDACVVGYLCGGVIVRVDTRLGAGRKGARSPLAVSYTHLTLPTICSV
eukprot:6608238-Prorocentrum_lima.AAC.1